MLRRNISMGLFGAAAGSVLTTSKAKAQTCAAPCYSQTAIEAAAGVTPSNTSYPQGNVRRYGGVLNGTTDDSVAFNTCLSIAPHTINLTVLVDGSLFLGSDITIPGNVQIQFVQAGQLRPGLGKTITLGQVPLAGLSQIFDYSAGGVILMPPLCRSAEVWAEWWGANGDGVTNLNNEVAINAAMLSLRNGGAGSGGTVRLGEGEFFISNVINIQNFCSLRGMNYWTLIKANGAVNWASVGGIMINATNATSMYDSRLENLRVDANSIGSIGYVVNVTAWNQRCGLFNCVLINFSQYSFYYSVGVGGSAHLELHSTDFFPNDVNNAVGAYVSNTDTVGWMNLELYQCSFASGGVSATTGLQIDNRVNAICMGVDIETIQDGITLTKCATLTGSGLSAGGNAGVAAIVRCAGSWTSPGYVNVSGVHLGGAAAMLSDANRPYAIAAIEPYDGQLVWPPSMGKAVGACRITGGAAPVVSAAQGVCSTTISHQATGHQRLTLSTSMEGTSTILAKVDSMDTGAPQAQGVPVDATHVDIYTKGAAGSAADSGNLFVQIFRSP
jgi:Pectate lyase superfamily protein